jgi:hypothetical protein
MFISREGRGCTAAVIAGVTCLVLLTAWLHLLERGRADGNKWRRVTTELGGFVRVFAVYNRRNVPPPETLEAAMATNIEPGLKTLQEGVDPWGSPYFYQVSEELTRGGLCHYKVTLRSFGPNRRDDGGDDDDIQRTYDVLVVLPPSNGLDDAAGVRESPK